MKPNDIYRGSCRKLLEKFEKGSGKPEALSGNLRGEFSRRIDEQNRLVYHVENGRIWIVACRTHYGEK